MNSGGTNKGNTLIVCLSPYSGGMEMDAIKLARLLCDDVRVTLLAKTDHYVAQHYNKNMQGSNISLETVDFSSAFSLSIIRKTRTVLASKKITNVIFFGASELRSLYFAFLGHKLNVVVRHGTTKTRPKKDWLHRLIYSCVDYHVAICQHLADNVKFIIPFAAKTQLKIIYPSLRQVPDLSDDKDKNGIVRLLHVGRVTDGKGQKEAIEACSVLCERNIPFELVCVGEIDPAYKRSITEFLNSKSYASSISLVGFSNDIDSYYRKAQIFIFPSKGEGLGNAFIEALSYGLICISYENTVFPELQRLGFSFYMAEDQDIEDLKEKLLIAVDQAAVHGFPIAGQSIHALKLFGPEREKNEFLEILQ